MDEAIEQQWWLLGNAVAHLSGIQWGEVTFRLEDGKFVGRVETRQTHKFEQKEKTDAE